MTSSPLKASLIAVLALGPAQIALAQATVDPKDQAVYDQQQQDYQDKQRDYQRQQQDYQSKQDDYQNRVTDYQSHRDTYAYQRDRYAQDRAAYDRQRDAYDAQNGAGSWERKYGYGYRRRSIDDNYVHYYADTPCERSRESDAATGGVIGALAGAAIGSSLAGRGSHTEGAVLGAVAGGAIGSSVGSNNARCDGQGYYFSYSQTYPYQRADSDYVRNDPYVGMHCRLATAPAYADGVTDYRYVRVCPDGSGRYRITPDA